MGREREERPEPPHHMAVNHISPDLKEEVCTDPALATSLLQALEEHQREAAVWLEAHHAKLRSVVKSACRSISSKDTCELWESTHSSAHEDERVQLPQLMAEKEKLQLPRHMADKAPLPQHSAREVEDDPLQSDLLQSDHLQSEGTSQTWPALLPDHLEEDMGTALSFRVEPENSLKAAGKETIRRLMSHTSTIGEHQRSRFLQQVLDKREWSEQCEGRSLRGRLESVVRGNFDVFIGCLIILNTVVMFAELEITGRNPGATANEMLAFSIFRHCFNTIFFLELLVKVYVFRCWFWHSLFNVLDTLIVFITVVDAYVLAHVGSDFSSAQIMRLVRFARLVRMLRVIRTLELFQQLRVLLSTIAASYMSLFWSMVVLFIFMLTSSLILCQLLQDFVVDSSYDDQTRRWVQKHYGTSSRSLYTVFELTFSGCWPNYARTLIEDVSGWFTVFFAIYVTGVVFAMIRIISALFLKDTLTAAANDADFLVQEKQSEVKTFVAKLSDLFREADTNGDGFLSSQEMAEVLSYPKVKLWMNVIGLDVSDTKSLFDVLAGHDGRVSSDEFVKGIMRLKGTARNQDIFLIMRDCDRILRQCLAARSAIEALDGAARAAIEALETRWGSKSCHRGP